MARRGTAEQLVREIRDLRKALRIAEQVLPVVTEQARLAKDELVGRLPETVCINCEQPRRGHNHASTCPKFTPAGLDYSGDPPPSYNDPTGETVVNFRVPRDGPTDATRDRERIQALAADVLRLHGTIRSFLIQAPAAAVSVFAGRSPTDGRQQDEFEQAHFVHALIGARCTVALDHSEDEPPFGPGELRLGMCNRHRMAFDRWAARNAQVGEERPAMIARWQTVTYGHDRAVQPDAEIVDLGVYKTRGIRKVA
jgi:hypothetical protein